MESKTTVGKEIINITHDLVDITTEIGEMVGNVLIGLSEKLSVPVAHVYEVFCRQKFIEGISELFLICIPVVISLFFIKISYNKDFFEKCDYEGGPPTRHLFIFISGIGIFLIAFIAMASNLPTTISKIINPEYFVIRDIMIMVQGIVK